jgi:hypothetical protein
MNRYLQARKYINIKEVKRLHEKKVAKQIALQEQQYLLYFTENTIPKYYNWETGQFNENPLAEVKSAVFKRLEEIDDALLEGMTMKDFKYLYGGEIGSQILSISPTLVSSTFAQDLISASGEVTSHMFGPEFPGSHVNSIGDFDKPESLSKVDAQASASWNSIQDVTPSGWTPDSSYEYVSSASDVVSPGQETDTFKDTHFGEVAISGDTISLSTGNDDSEDNTVDIEDLKTLFPGITFPKGVPDQHGEVYDPTEASMILRTFKSVSVGQVISFDYSFTSLETEEDTAGIVGPTGFEAIQSYRGANREIAGGDGNVDDYGFVLVGNSVEKIVSVFAKDGNNSDFNFTDVDGQFKPEILQSRFPLTGKYSYTVKQSDIDSYGNLKFFIGVMDGEGGSFESNIDITNLSIIDGKRAAAGQLGKTTDAYDLGTSVASLDPNKKKKEKEQEERRRKFEQERLKKDKEYKKKEEERKRKEEERKRKEEEEKKKEKKPLTLNQVEKIYMKKYANPNDPEDAYRRYKVWEYNYGIISYFTKDAADGTYNYEEAGRISAMIPFRMNRFIPFRIGAKMTGRAPSTESEVMAHANKYKKHKKEIDNYNAVKEWERTIKNPYFVALKARRAKAKAAKKEKEKAGQLGKTTAAYGDGTPKYRPYDGRDEKEDWNNWKEKIKARDNAKKLTPKQKQQQKQVQKAISDNPEIANAIEKLGSQAKTYFDYLTNNLPDVIDNKYLGKKYVNNIFKDASVNSKGNIHVGDNIVGTGGKATYNKKTGKVTIPFNYDFDTNAQEIAKNPERLQNKTGFKKVIIDLTKAVGGEYGLDSLPVAPAGRVTATAKSLGGAKQRPGKVTMSAAEVNKLNPLLHAQIVGTTGLMRLSTDVSATDASTLASERKTKKKKKKKNQRLGQANESAELYPGQPSPNGFPDTPPPKMVNGYHPEFGKRSDRYRRLDPVSAVVMNKVGTEDPETNKQVAAAAKKPKVKLVPNTRSKTDKVTEAVWPKGLWSKAKRYW